MIDMTLLNSRDRRAIVRLLNELHSTYDSAEDAAFLLDAPVHARRLPRRLQHFLNRFRREERGYAVIAGHAVDNATIGPTPAHWKKLPEPSPTLEHDFLLVLYASLLGDPFGWATQQDGRIVHDVLPIKENEGQQLGTAADVLLDWHTEDAFHPHRPDWVILLCLRNPSETATTVAPADDLALSEEDVRVLFESRFYILPDNSHMPQHNFNASAEFDAIQRLLDEPPIIPLLSGDPRRPYIRVDRSFWGVADLTDTQALATLQRFTDEIERQLRDVVLRPGDVCILDNYKVAHGRRPFPARYDGTDRWLKRVCVTRDLRKSRSSRPNVLSHIIG